jgi:hypothetical protein
MLSLAFYGVNMNFSKQETREVMGILKQDFEDTI